MFLSRFWVSKWHLKILQWHPKFWKPRHGFALYWSKTIWGGKHVFLHMAVATDGCNVTGWLNFLAQKLEAKIVCLVTVHCHAHRLAWPLTTLPHICTVLCVRNCKKHLNAIMEVFFDVAIGWWCIKLQWRQQVGSCSAHARCKTRWLSSEAAVGARCEILGIWAALKQLSENKNDAMCVVLLRLMKTRI